MPIKRAAFKAHRQNVKARARNLVVKQQLKKLAVQFRKAAVAKNADQLKSVSRDFTKALDKAAQKKVISRNTAARKKSRVALALRRALA